MYVQCNSVHPCDCLHGPVGSFSLVGTWEVGWRGGSWSSLRRGREKYRVGEGGGEEGGGMYILATFSLQCRGGI